LPTFSATSHFRRNICSPDSRAVSTRVSQASLGIDGLSRPGQSGASRMAVPAHRPRPHIAAILRRIRDAGVLRSGVRRNAARRRRSYHRAFADIALDRLPFFANVRAPSRAIVFVYLFLSIGIGFAAATVLRRRGIAPRPASRRGGLDRSRFLSHESGGNARRVFARIGGADGGSGARFRRAEPSVRL